MGLNKSSFELGASLVQGYFDDVRKDEDRKIAEEDRQRRIKEYDIRMEDLTRRNEEAKQEAADKKALRAAANPEMNSGTIVDGGTKTFTQDPAEAARVKAIEDAANFDDKPVKAESGFGLKDGKIVTQKQANDPLFGAGLQAEWLRKNGRTAEAFDLETKIEAAKTVRAAAEKRAFSDEAIKAAQEGGARGFADWFNANSKNGMQMRVLPALNGKGSILAWGRDGDVEATYPIESDGALYSAVSRIIDPVASAKAYDSQQAAVAASRAKVTDAYTTELAKQQARVAAGTAGVSGSRTSQPSAAQLKADALASRSAAQVASEGYMQVFKESKDNTTLPQPQEVAIQIENLAKNNPGMTAAQLQAYGVNIAKNPNALPVTFDGKGNVVRTYTDPRDSSVNFVVNRVPLESLSAEEKKMLASRSGEMVSRLVGPENLPLAQAFVHGDAKAQSTLEQKLYESAVDEAARELAEIKRSTGIKDDRDETTLIHAKAERKVDTRLRALMDAKTFIAPPRKTKPTTTPTASQSSGSWSEFPGLMAGQIGKALWGSKQ